MKFIVTLLMLSLMSCSFQTEKVYLLIDEKDELIVKEDRYYYLFENQEQLLKYKKVKNYKAGDVLKSNDTIEFKDQPFCPGASFSIIEEKSIDLKTFKTLNVMNRESLYQMETKASSLFFIEKISDNHFLIKKTHVYVCE